MKLSGSFFCMLASNVLLVSSSQLLQRDLDPQPTCTYPATKPVPKGAQCAVKGTVPKTAANSILSDYNGGYQSECMENAVKWGGKSWAYNPSTHQCTIYTKNLSGLKFKKNNASKTVFSDAVCNKEVCKCPAKAKTICDGREGPRVCVDLKTNKYFCGDCDTICEDQGSICVNSKCSCPNNAQTNCGTGGYKTCTDLKTDNDHCGACDNECPTNGSECIDGKCSACPPENPDLCPATDRYGAGCVNLQTSYYNCGACENACSYPYTCVNGTCACPPGKVDDGQGSCVAENESNCGKYGNACPSGVSCIDGECKCGSGLETCPNGCADLSSSSSNCGSCGNACGPGQFCNGGSCTCYNPGTTYCLVGCYDLQSDDDFCGACDNPCPRDARCKDGSCKCQNPDQTACPKTETRHEYCTYLNTEQDCGKCGVTCGQHQYCEGGSCRDLYNCGDWNGSPLWCKDAACTRCS